MMAELFRNAPDWFWPWLTVCGVCWAYSIVMLVKTEIILRRMKGRR